MGLRLSEKDAEKFGLTPRKKSSKYKNIRTGRGFASKKEERRWDQLVMLEGCGKISDLKKQVTFRFEHNGILICRYIADATYMKDGKFVVEDTKSPATRTAVYKIKKSLMLAFHGLEIRET